MVHSAVRSVRSPRPRHHQMYNYLRPITRLGTLLRDISPATYQPKFPSTIARINSPNLTAIYKYGTFASSSHTKRGAISYSTVILVTGVTIAGAAVYAQFGCGRCPQDESPSHQQQSPASDHILLTDLFGMPSRIAPGRPGNLTAEQEAKLRDMWLLVNRLFGTTLDTEQLVNGTNGASPTSISDTTADSIPPSEKDKEKKKKRFSVFRKEKSKDKDKDQGKKKDAASTTSPASGTMGDILSHVDENDKHGQTKVFKEAMAQLSPEQIRQAMWDMIKHDHPDGLLLRFLRARKWDVQAAVVMMISTMQWRLSDAKVDSDVMMVGEEGMIKAGNGAEGAAVTKKDGEDFMTIMRMGKSFLRGVDIEGRPMCIVRVRLHRAGEQSESSLERYTVYTIETARMFLKTPVDTATIVFDMTDFGLANMDYAPVKFMIKCFEANYPESLGAILVHRAPWIFSSIWKIIKGWLDPVVASKVHFTNNIEDLSKFIERSAIIRELGGPVDFEYKYTEPVEGENRCMADTATRDRIQQQRTEIVKQFEQNTLEWIQAYSTTSDASQEEKDAIGRHRHEIAKELRENYWQLDPYVRARGLYDRTAGLLKNFVDYPEEDEESERFHTAPGSPTMVSMDVRRSIEAATQVNGAAP